MVRRVGPGVPLRADRARRPGVRQEAAAAAAARVVHAPQRADPGVRVGLRRREPAGARVGRAAGLRDRRVARPRLPGQGVPQAAAQLHLVGQPQGQRRQQHLRGRLPRAGQHRPDRPLGPAAGGRAARAERRHGVDGDVRAQPAGDGARPRRARPELRGPGDQVPRALRLHRRGDGRHGPVGRAGRLLLRRSELRRRVDHAAAGPVDGGPASRCARPRRWVRGPWRRCPTSRPGSRWFLEHRPRYAHVVGETHVRDGHLGRLLSVVDGERLVRILATMLSEDEFLSPHGLRALSRRHRDQPFTVDLGRRGRSPSTTSPASRAAGCSAATPTGGGRCGSPSTTW